MSIQEVHSGNSAHSGKRAHRFFPFDEKKRINSVSEERKKISKLIYANAYGFLACCQGSKPIFMSFGDTSVYF